MKPVCWCWVVFFLSSCSTEKRINLLTRERIAAMTHRLEPRRSQTTDRDQVFSLDENGVLRISGEGWGYIETPEFYRDYRLIVEYRWGEQTFGRRADKARDAGIFLHCHDRYGDWPKGIEVQLIEGGSGNLNILDGKNVVSVSGRFASVEGNRAQFRERAEPVKIGGKTIKVFCNYRPEDWKDEKGYRGKADLEMPLGEWNRLEVICAGKAIEVRLNGTLVNRIGNLPETEGPVAIQSEEAEWFVRRMEILPLPGSG
jgi:hypothetical protein